VNVRDAVDADAAAIADVHIRTWQAAYANVFPAEGLKRLDDARPARERFWRETLESQAARRHVLVAEVGARVVGFVSVGPTRDAETLGELYAIYVLAEEWGHGAGPALMAEALERLRGSGFESAILWVVDDNPRARAFYEHWGWSLDGGERAETFLATQVREVRYRIDPREA
jgi:GNAT superfamily N-acetyltransferase